MPSYLNEALIGIKKRAERNDPASLIATFVDIGMLFAQLSTTDNQVIYGRRGTGKTHALIYLANSRRKAGDIAVYIDMRTIGSTGGLYADVDVPVTERGTRLLVDTVGRVLDDLTNWTLSEPTHFESDSEFDRVSRALDAVGASITDVRVVGDIETENRTTERHSQQRQTGLATAIGEHAVLGAQLSTQKTGSRGHETRVRRRGRLQQRVHFGDLSHALTTLLEALGRRRVWILLDEWSEVPRDLQPLLADMLRRAFFPIQQVTVKIAAIEHRTALAASSSVTDQYVGIDSGDAGADLNLDDFMLFGADETRATEFFRSLFFKHVRAVLRAEGRSVVAPGSEFEMVRAGFHDGAVFAELVRAAEGVPRDAIYIAAGAAARAGLSVIGYDDIRRSARAWYLRDKENTVRSSGEAYELLLWIIDRVMRGRRIRGFMLPQTVNSEHAALFEKLYDARVLHLVRRDYSEPNSPGVRLDAYLLDYGCYVDITEQAGGSRAPRSAGWFRGAPDDFIEISSVILDLAQFK